MDVAAGQVAKLRSQAYMLLSLVFRQPEPRLVSWFGSIAASNLIRKIIKGLPSPAPGTQLQALVRMGRAMAEAGEIPELVAEYNRLFSSTPLVRVPLWASAYIGGEQKVCGEPALRASGIYARAGCGLASDFPDQPDHLVPELQFMSMLSRLEGAAWQRRDLEGVIHWVELEDEFVFEHLCPWTADGLVPRMQEWVPTGFYSTAVSALVELQSMDRSWTRSIRQGLVRVVGGGKVHGDLSQGSTGCSSSSTCGSPSECLLPEHQVPTS